MTLSSAERIHTLGHFPCEGLMRYLIFKKHRHGHHEAEGESYTYIIKNLGKDRGWVVFMFDRMLLTIDDYDKVDSKLQAMDVADYYERLAQDAGDLTRIAKAHRLAFEKHFPKSPDTWYRKL